MAKTKQKGGKGGGIGTLAPTKREPKPKPKK